MKKERLTDNESELIENSASVDFNYILNNLNSSVKSVNNMFNLNISFSLNEEFSRLNSKEDTKEDNNEDKGDDKKVKETDTKEDKGDDNGDE